MSLAPPLLHSQERSGLFSAARGETATAMPVWPVMPVPRRFASIRSGHNSAWTADSPNDKGTFFPASSAGYLDVVWCAAGGLCTREATSEMQAPGWADHVLSRYRIESTDTGRASRDSSLALDAI